MEWLKLESPQIENLEVEWKSYTGYTLINTPIFPTHNQEVV